MTWTVERKLAGVFTLILIVMATIGVVSYRNTLGLIDNGERVATAGDVVRALDRTLTTMVDAESDQRGFVITGDERFLANYNGSLLRINDQILALNQLATDNPTQRQRLPGLQRAINNKLTHVRKVITLRREQGFAAAQREVATGEGRIEMDQIRQIIGVMRAEEDARLADSLAQTQSSARRAFWTIALLTLFSFVLLPIMFFLIQRDTAARKRIEQAQMLARDRAIEASRLKSEFLATMSHEIRTPMNGVLGMTELLLETPLDDEQREFAGIVRESGQALLTIIDDILDFSKIEAGRLVLESHEFDPAVVVEGVAEILAPKAREKRLRLMTFIDPEIPRPLVGDAGRLRQILVNLTGNAIKFTERGEIVVQVTRAEDDKQGMMLRFSVRDTGIGLSSEASSRLFEAFMQADSSTTRRFGGTGLGLAISKRLAEVMGGAIGVDSVEGQGSTFWFTARFLPAAVTATVPPVLPQSSLHNLRVLVVDSNTTQRDILRRYLQSWGMRDAGASSGAEALSRLQTAAVLDSFEFVIIDQDLPDTDAYNLAQCIRENVATAHIRLLLLTNFEERSRGERALRAGFAGLLSKPLKQSQLFDAIATIYDRPGLLRTQPGSTAVQAIAQPLSEHTVLLVEDNPANQRVAQAQLAKLGYPVVTVEHGQAAIDTVTDLRASYGVVLMDVQMPLMDGLTATRIIRREEHISGRHTPIIAMTANAMEGDLETCLAAGMDDYLSKPLSYEILRQVLNRWMPISAEDEAAH